MQNEAVKKKQTASEATQDHIDESNKEALQCIYLLTTIKNAAGSACQLTHMGGKCHLKQTFQSDGT